MSKFFFAKSGGPGTLNILGAANQQLAFYFIKNNF